MRRVIFTMGTPASGKTTLARHFYPNATVINSDAYKRFHPQFEPKNISLAVHKWSAKRAEYAYRRALEDGCPELLSDGTGANSTKLLEKIMLAHSKNYETVLLYVITSLRTALVRNASRPRSISESLLREKHEAVLHSYPIVAEAVGTVHMLSADAQNRNILTIQVEANGFRE